jgi:hypothetical protein
MAIISDIQISGNAYFQDNSGTPLTTSFVKQEFGFASFSIAVENNSGTGYIEYSFDGVAVHGRIALGKKPNHGLSAPAPDMAPGPGRRRGVSDGGVLMGFTKEQLDAIEDEIANLTAASFSAGELSIDQEKTLKSLIKKRDVIKAELGKGGGMTFGKAKIDGVDG